MNTLEELQEYVKDKRIIVVGNNLSALEKKQATLIDSYDIVLRFGKGILQGWEEYIGYKTDIWSTGNFRSPMRSLLPKETVVLYNQGGTHNVKSSPPYPHILMYEWDDACAVSTKYTGDWEHCRLSNGAITAHFMYNKVGTFKQMDFINFDFFTVSCKFRDRANEVDSITNSWHLPLTPPKYFNKGTDNNCSHDPLAEQKVFNEISEDPRCNILGVDTLEERFMEVRHAAWDKDRAPIK